MACNICNKKLTLTQQEMVCKCDKMLCSKHKLNHNCMYDYKQIQQQKLKKYLKKVEVKKIVPI